MNAERYTLDSNIVFYAVDRDAGARHERARQLVHHAVKHDCILTVQTLGETYRAILSKRPQFAAVARELLSYLQAVLPIAGHTASDFTQAVEWQQRYAMQFWDAMLWATAKRNGCSVVLTEDTQSRPVIDGVRSFNPFAATDEDQLARFLP